MINIIIYNNQLLLEQIDNTIVLPTDNSLKLIQNAISPIILTEDKLIASLVDDEELVVNHPRLKLTPIRQAFQHLDQQVLFDVIYYKQLHEYYITHKYCGRCGMETKRQNQNKFVRCNNCDCEIYPHIAPCVIVRIHKQDQILMARGINFPPNSWGLIAGFVELGETLEEAVKREVLEEVGLEIDNIKYWGSQPWPLPSNTLMVAYTADYKSGDIVPQADEIAAAGFFDKINIPGKPSSQFSIASRMINEYINS